mgnify:FL=1
MEEGETAFRIMDPRMDSGDTVTSEHREVTDDREWYAVLWDSVAVEAESDVAVEPGAEADTPL